MPIGLRFKDKLPAGPIKNEFEQLVAALQSEFATLHTVETIEVSNFIVSVQEVLLTIAPGSVTSGPVALSIPVDPRYTEVALQGMGSDYGFSQSSGVQYAYISDLTSTTITAIRLISDDFFISSTAKLRVVLTQYRATALLQPVQLGHIVLAATETTKTTSVNLLGPKSRCLCTGFSNDTESGGGSRQGDILCTVRKYSNVQLIWERSLSLGAAHVGYCVVDFA